MLGSSILAGHTQILPASPKKIACSHGYELAKRRVRKKAAARSGHCVVPGQVQPGYHLNATLIPR